MKYLFVVFLFVTTSTFAQSSLSSQSDSAYTEVDKMPEFPKGEEAFYKYLAKTIRYPSEARRSGTEGTVFLMFIVEKDGRVTNVEVKKGVSDALDAESVRVVAASPNWIPGTLNGNPMRVQIIRPVKYKLAR